MRRKWEEIKSGGRVRFCIFLSMDNHAYLKIKFINKDSEFCVLGEGY